jgi:hypothetical protein
MTIPNFQLYYRAIITKTAHKDQWNGIEDSEIKPTIWFLANKPKTHTGEKIPSSTTGAGKTGYLEGWI